MPPVHRDPPWRTVFDASVSRLESDEQLVLALARPALDTNTIQLAVAAARQRQIHWQQALDVAAQQWLSPLLGTHINNYPELREAVPRETREQLAIAALTARVRVDRFERALAPALDLLEQQQVVFCLLKGAALLQYAYPAGKRPINDFDVLVRPADLATVCMALEAAGFALDPTAHTPTDVRTEARYSVTLERQFEGVQLTVSVHWHLYPASVPFRFDEGALLERAHSVEVAGHRAYAASPEDAFVHYATQLPRDRLSKTVLRLVDLAALASMPSLDFEHVVSIAQSTHAQAPTHLALIIAAALGANVPDHALCALADSSPRKPALARWLIDARWLSSVWTLPYAMQLLIAHELHGTKNTLLRAYLDAHGGPARARTMRAVRLGFARLVFQTELTLARWIPPAAAWLRSRLWRRIDAHRRTTGATPLPN